eukprot:4961099-Pyramimonas_sp.AAC.1
MEHPAPAPWRPQSISSWETPEISWALELPGVDYVQVDQCAYGARSRKPTGLLAVNAPELRLA